MLPTLSPHINKKLVELNYMRSMRNAALIPILIKLKILSAVTYL